MKISTSDAISPNGHYSPAVVHNGLVYVSGQLPFDPQTGAPIHSDAAAEAAAAIANLERVLKESGSGLNKVLKCNVYVSDIEYWDEINEVYARLFGDHKPARAIVPTGPLHFGFKVEIDAIAIVDAS